MLDPKMPGYCVHNNLAVSLATTGVCGYCASGTDIRRDSLGRVFTTLPPAWQPQAASPLS